MIDVSAQMQIRKKVEIATTAFGNFAYYVNFLQNLFYSRKNYKRPELQISPHQAFEEEVSLLDSFFSGE